MNGEADKSDEELTEVPVSPARPRPNGRRHDAPPPQRKLSAEVLRPEKEETAPPEEPPPVVHKSASMPSKCALILLVRRASLKQKCERCMRVKQEQICSCEHCCMCFQRGKCLFW